MMDDLNAVYTLLLDHSSDSVFLVISHRHLKRKPKSKSKFITYQPELQARYISTHYSALLLLVSPVASLAFRQDSVESVAQV